MTEKQIANQKLREEMRKKVEKIRKIKLKDYEPDTVHHNTWGNKKEQPVMQPDMLIN